MPSLIVSRLCRATDGVVPSMFASCRMTVIRHIMSATCWLNWRRCWTRPPLVTLAVCDVTTCTSLLGGWTVTRGKS